MMPDSKCRGQKDIKEQGVTVLNKYISTEIKLADGLTGVKLLEHFLGDLRQRFTNHFKTLIQRTEREFLSKVI